MAAVPVACTVLPAAARTPHMPHPPHLLPFTHCHAPEIVAPCALTATVLQIADLEASVNAVPCDTVMIATPMDLRKIIKIEKPATVVSVRLPLLLLLLPQFTCSCCSLLCRFASRPHKRHPRAYQRCVSAHVRWLPITCAHLRAGDVRG